MFGTDAVRLSQLMITIQNQIVDADDPRSGYLMDGKNTLIYGFFFLLLKLLVIFSMVKCLPITGCSVRTILAIRGAESAQDGVL